MSGKMRRTTERRRKLSMSDRTTSHFQIGWRLFKACANYTQLGALFVIAFLLNSAGAAILGLGLVISFPVSLLAIAGFYRSLPRATA
jgi:hypothetical protein